MEISVYHNYHDDNYRLPRILENLETYKRREIKME
jgi:hypothetical protein